MVVIFIGFVILAIVIGAWAYSNYLARLRREAFAKVARSLGLSFSPAKDFSIPQRCDFLNKLSQGSNRYAYNVISGNYQGQDVLTFDYHYETHSTDSKGRRRTHHHHFSFFMLLLPRSFPELIICHENWLSKFAQFFGYDDIDFESAEFSRNFCVRSGDKKFAYDFCHARMIEFLLANQDLDIEVEHDCLTLFFSSRLKPDDIHPNLDRLIEIRKMIPDYVFETGRPV